jgi:formylglycine-generating enzyme required for sulfatase activity
MTVWKMAIYIMLLFLSAGYAAEKTTIAVLELEPKGVQNNEASVISDWVREELFNSGKYKVVERTQMKDVLKEWGFQQAICNESECIIRAGNILGVEQMVAGSVQKIGNLLSLSIRIVDVKTGEIVTMVNSPCDQCSIEDFALRSVRAAVAELTGAISTIGAGQMTGGRLLGMEFVYIPSGTFMMGFHSKDEFQAVAEESLFDNESPSHRVIIRPFYMMTTEVTQAQWQAVMNNNPSNFKGDNLPVETVSWNDCQEFISKLNQMDPDKGYRLPTEAEWEYACRAGTSTLFCNGNYTADLAGVGWYGGISEGTTHPVKTKEANSWGLYDMHGNVLEWCADRYHENYFGAPADGSAWLSSDNTSRVLRGGSWQSPGSYWGGGCRSIDRFWDEPEARGSNAGLRLVHDR